MRKPANIIEAVRSRGSDAEDLRDAAHEACHALTWRVRGSWDRENIHAFKPSDKAQGLRDEILARAVEQLVCRRLGVDCGTVERWASTAILELLKNEHIVLQGDDVERIFAEQVRHAMTGLWANMMANRIERLRVRKIKSVGRQVET